MWKIILLIYIFIICKVQCSLIDDKYDRLSDKIPVTELFAFFGVVFDEFLKRHIHNLLMCDNKIVIIGGWVIGFMPYALRIIYKLFSISALKLNSIDKIWSDHYINNSKKIRWIGDKNSESKAEGIALVFIENIKYILKKNVKGKRPGRVYIYKQFIKNKKIYFNNNYLISFVILLLEILFLILIIYYSIKENSYVGLGIIVSGYITSINFNYCLILCGPSNEIKLPEMENEDKSEKVIYLDDNDENSISLFIGDEDMLEGSVIRKPKCKGIVKINKIKIFKSELLYIYIIFSSFLVVLQMIISIILADDISYKTGIIIIINIFISLFINSYRGIKWNKFYIFKKIFANNNGENKYMNIVIFDTESWAENIYISCYVNKLNCWDYLLLKLPKEARCKKDIIESLNNYNDNNYDIELKNLTWYRKSMYKAIINISKKDIIKIENETNFTEIKCECIKCKN